RSAWSCVATVGGYSSFSCYTFRTSDEPPSAVSVTPMEGERIVHKRIAFISQKARFAAQQFRYHDE
ncbi:MAG: hypothetical protein ACLTE8_07045, partial [Christensenellales bacterium]